jgi:PilZ domain-containing protein
VSKRSDYRHTFGPRERPVIGVAVSGRPPYLRGRILNLSLRGALIEICDPAGLLKDAGWAVVRFEIPDAALEYHCRIVYAAPGDGLPQFALRFIRLLDPRDNARRERTLWRYLLEEQRRQIRKMKLLQ